ncbi:DUF2924 domain-containing protein [uncultured Shimia sp.]|uniref:DUF2924 domain-containing protein n=1 Tax=uncultured Shimia sp. TaxID=573152 RepID=UPI00262EC62F|nr:DUF2924 domain-containing protein [uncultured Shimia sp.]
MKSVAGKIETMERAALMAVWSEVFNAPVPKRLSSPFLRRFLAFELQARESSGLPKGFVAKLGQAARQDQFATSPALKPGGRLIREWNGVTHVVDVVEGGFLWNNQRYASLSPIARAITGARWSGPRFFGLRGSP